MCRLQCFGLRVAAIALVALTWRAGAIDVFAPPTNEGVYVLDHAAVVTESYEQRINAFCKTFEADQGVPLYVLTMPSISESGGGDLSMERFARLIFEEWGRNDHFVGRANWREGILLLVSFQDRKARIELGKSWAGNYDEQCQRIMDQRILPPFKEKLYSKGIYQGVEGLEAMVRGEVLPTWTYDQILALLGILSFFGVSLAFLYIAGKVNTYRGVNHYGRDRAHSSRGSSGSDYGGGGGATGSW